MTKESDLKVLREAQISAADLLASRMAQRYTTAAIVLAMAQRQALDVGDVYAFLRTLADGCEHMAATATNPLLARAHSMTADELAAIEPMVRRMLTVPAGAGRA
jgi:hypothetical protein